MREKFQYDMQELQSKLQNLADLTAQALEKSVDCLIEQNVEEALNIMEDDSHIDKLEEEINDLAILLIAKQQPVAIDLRRIVTTIKIAADIERIADFAVNIAKSTIRIGNEPLIKRIETIKEMQMLTTEMLTLAIQAFIDEDTLSAKKVADMDDKVDSLHGEAIRDLFNLLQTEAQYTNQLTQLAFVSRYLERVGDHITNISENIFYLVKGRHYQLNN